MALRKEHRLASVPTGFDQSLAIRLVEHLIVATFVLDTTGRVLIWNKACERLTGVPAAEVVGTWNHWVAFHTEPRPCLADLVAAGRYDELERYYCDYTDFGLTDFGVSLEATLQMPRLQKTVTIAVDVGPIYDEAGTLLAVIQTFRDITAQKEAQSELQALAARDGLTNLHNRRSFDATLAGEIRRCFRAGDPLSLLMIDIDHFKLFNDRFGHLAGDECIKQIARTIGDVLRQGDVAARYGGEEFAVILPMTDREGAESVAERLRGTVQNLAIEHPDAPLGIVTLSIGASTGLDIDLSPADLVSASDEALYGSKRTGRNRIRFGYAQSSSVVLF